MSCAWIKVAEIALLHVSFCHTEYFFVSHLFAFVHISINSVGFVCSSEFYCLYCWRLSFIQKRVPTKSLYPYLLVLLVILASVISWDLFFNLDILGDHSVRWYFNITACLLSLAHQLFADGTCTRIFCVCSASASPFLPCCRSSQDKQVHNWSPSSFWKRGICMHPFKKGWFKSKSTPKILCKCILYFGFLFCGLQLANVLSLLLLVNKSLKNLPLVKIKLRGKDWCDMVALVV